MVNPLSTCRVCAHGALCALAALGQLFACNPSSPAGTPDASKAPSELSSVAASSLASGNPSSGIPSASPPPNVDLDAAPSVSDASNPEAAPSEAGSGDAAPGPARVKVEAIGMHIGGGPNSPWAKEPIGRSIEPSFGVFRKCYDLVEGAKFGDFGVDLLIEKDGGKAKVSDPRTVLKGKGFSECMVQAFEAVSFEKPRTGKTRVSYSVRFSKP